MAPELPMGNSNASGWFPSAGDFPRRRGTRPSRSMGTNASLPRPFPQTANPRPRLCLGSGGETLLPPDKCPPNRVP